MRASKRVVALKTGRTGAATAPASVNFVSADVADTTVSGQRVQRLQHAFGLPFHRAALIAALVWEAAHG